MFPTPGPVCRHFPGPGPVTLSLGRTCFCRLPDLAIVDAVVVHATPPF